LRGTRDGCATASLRYDGPVDRGEVCTRLAELRGSDPGLDRIFGGGAHGFDLAPPLSEAAVIAFESIHGIALPDAYRAFLLKVGSTGAGPGYGLTGLPTEPAVAATLVGTCPLTRQDAEDVRRRRATGEDHAFVERVPVSGAGVLSLCDHGCGWNSYLVISGPDRGAVWTGGELGWFPDADDFAGWYEAWLGDPLTT